MNIILSLVVSLFANLGANVTKKYFTQKNSPANSGGFVFNAVTFLIAAVILICWGGFSKMSTFTFILGIAFGLITAVQGITNLAAIQCGPMSYTLVIISFSTLLSALSGVLFFDESLGWAQIVGIVLMLISFTLATNSTADEKHTNLKWLFLCIVAFVATGGIGIMQKVHQSSAYKDELNEFLIIAFGVCAIVCTAFAVFLKKRENMPKETNGTTPLYNKSFWLITAIMLISGICVAVNNKLNLYLSGVMDSAAFFPIVNGGGLVLITITALVIFKERLSKRQWIGIIFGIVSVIFLCNPFV